MTFRFSFRGMHGAAGHKAAQPAGLGRYRPAIECLEDRVVMSTLAADPLLAPPLANALAHAARQVSSLVPLVVNSVTSTAGQLVANATLGSQTLQIPLDLTVPPGQAATSTTQILNLHVGAIDLQLLGLEVKTSEICLNISAQSAPGNLLGNLLTDVAHLLDQGVSLGQILGTLSGDLNTLTAGLTDLLNGALGQLTSPATLTSPGNLISVVPMGSTNILHLEVGPINLNLLGLMVNLDNCHNGPITVDIIAHTGPGNLLGNLLGGLAHLLDSNANVNALLNRLERIAAELAALL